MHCKQLFIVYLCSQDIRRFFGPVSGKPAVQQPAASENTKPKDKKKKSLFSEEDLKKKKGTKAKREYFY